MAHRFKDKDVRRKRKDTTHPAEFKVREATIAGLDVNDPVVMEWFEAQQAKQRTEDLAQGLEFTENQPPLGAEEAELFQSLLRKLGVGR